MHNTVPRRVDAEDIKKYVELLFRNTFDPPREAREGKVSPVCTRKTSGTVHRGVVVTGEEIKAQVKRKRATSSKENPNAEGRRDERKGDTGATKRRINGKDGKDNVRQWVVGCYGCSKHNEWLLCHAVSPNRQRHRCSYYGKKSAHRQGTCGGAPGPSNSHQDLRQARGVRADPARRGAEA